MIRRVEKATDGEEVIFLEVRTKRIKETERLTTIGECFCRNSFGDWKKPKK